MEIPRSAQRKAAPLRYQFLGGVSFLSKSAFKIAVQAVRGTAPMDTFMAEGRVVGGWLAEDFKPGKLDAVEGRAIKRAASAVPNLRAETIQENLGCFVAFGCG